MKRAAIKGLSAALLVAAAASTQAQSMKPGLWEHSYTMKSQSGQMEKAMAEMQKQLAAMPPAQRQQMEQMMAAQGVRMGGGGQTVQVCISPEQAARLDMPQADDQCKQEVTQRSGSSMKVKFSCTGNPPSHGEGEVTLRGDSAYEGKFWVQTRVDGKPERMDMTQRGKWLGANCGNLKPVR